MTTLVTQQLLERLASLLRSETRGQLLQYGLQPVQFDALQYLSVCNRYSDTPMAVTEFLGQTKGSVSQTLNVLEKKGLLTKKNDAKDKRITRLTITRKGRNLVDKLLPSPILQLACDHLGKQKQTATDSSLRSLLSTLQEVNKFKTFGQCATCQHNIKNVSGGYLCGLTQESLSEIEITLICREHEPDSQPRNTG